MTIQSNRARLLVASFCQAIALLSIGTACVRAAAAERHPNVVVVITDDQGYGDVGFHGNHEIRTPTIDALARSSLRLANFHVEPTCAETRAALMSGQFPARNGVWHTIMGRSILRKDAVTLPQLFQQAGYRTGMFGKWHLGDNYPYRPQDRGFDVTLHHGGGGVGQLPDVWGNDYFDDVYWAGDQLQPVRGYCTDVFFDAAKEFIQGTGDQPFFCYLATNAPHGPYNVPDEYKKPYVDAGIPEPRASFYGMITNIDDNLAELLALLEKRGIADDTIVIFMTDNGTAAGYVPAQDDRPAQGFNAGMRAIKGSPYEGGHRVPCFIRYAKELPVDQEFDQLCAHVDLLPTLARLCSLDTQPISKLDGQDLVDYINGEKAWRERVLVVQSHRVEEPVQWQKSAVMSDRWRLVDGAELYDIKADAAQQHPLSGPESQETIDQLRAAYEKWWSEMAIDPNEYSSIVLGAPKAEQVRLTGHDWHGAQPPWNQDVVKTDPASEGFWAVEVSRPGAYQFLLSRRPLEEPAPLGCTKARVEIGGKVAEIAVDPTTVLAPLTLRLEAGETKLRTQLISDGGATRGAYFVTVNFLGDVPQAAIDAQATRLPEWLRPGDRVAWLGGTLVERAAETGALETETLLRAPLAGLSFVNLGWSGDDYTGRARAVFGSPEEGSTRRLNDLRSSGASVVVIAYGMSELLDSSTDDKRIHAFQSGLNELLAAIAADGRRAVLCLPPAIVNDVGGSAAKETYHEVCEGYRKRTGPLVNMLRETALEHNLPLIKLPAVPTSLFESGTYLSADGYRDWAGRAVETMFATARSPSVPSRVGEQELYKLAAESQRLFFDMYRPQNETYLLLFRKHEQGNNAVEIGQYRPLVADAQLKLIQAAAHAK